eukprot:COSAG06_NODE_59_length_27189_cov_21.724527_18_plen_64_part_00
MKYFDLAVSRPPSYLPASWVGMLRVCPESKELVPMVLFKNIGLRDAIATVFIETVAQLVEDGL